MFIGYSWVNVFHQDGEYFPHGTGSKHRKEVLRYNEEDLLADRRSILYRMEEYRRKDGLFHIRLCYPEYSELFPCNEWTQSSNFVKDTEITDFTALEITYKNAYWNLPFPGLKKITGWYTNYFLFSPLHWWFGIGYSCCSIYGPYGKPGVKSMDVYLAGGNN